VQINAAFKKRLDFYCKDKGIDMNEEAIEKLAELDAKAHTGEFEECQKYVRARIFNDKEISNLEQSIKAKLGDIIRPFCPSFDSYFMKIAEIAKRRSNCIRNPAGCVIVNQRNRVVSTGCNGTFPMMLRQSVTSDLDESPKDCGGE
jgi:deoxycytidylate deaminase